MENRYLKYINEYLAEIRGLNRKSTLAGLIKLVLLVIFVVFLWKGIQSGYAAYSLAGMTAAFILSVPMWIYHNIVVTKIKKLKAKVIIAESYIKRIQGSWADFAVTGQEYVDYQHSYSYDLDIFGDKSLFQFLNIAGTRQGREQLYRDLAESCYNEAEIKSRQQGIGELSAEGYDHFRFEYQYQSELVRENEKFDSFIDLLTDGKYFFKAGWLRKLFGFMPLVTLLICVLAFAAGLVPLRLPAIILLGAQMVMWIALLIKTHGYLASVQEAKLALEEYDNIFKLISAQSFDAEVLKEINDKLGQGKAGKAVKILDGIVQRISLNGNIITNVMLNILLLWDINCSLSLEKWKRDYAKELPGWLKALGDFEAMMSLSVAGSTVSGMSFPVQIQEKGMRAAGLGHPLIQNDSRICNDFDMKNEVYVVSGSNMSGKTTFLRTVGINLVLAKAGAAVCADRMEFSDMHVMTSMRIVDDLHDGISTFYAELKKIKSIVSYTKKDLIFLIDEIFRGTNSEDRTEGAKAVMARLSENGACGLLTTHDLKLCESTEEVQIKNYHFSEKYMNGKLCFEYKIRDGIAKTTNGRYLMQMLGLIGS